ncbi:E3 ubiquitin-protein ligase RHA2A-like [Salvia splendens]|uniref:E3 ubiquitin-protein ligase RHA2A-like n=1 Tax=Salvia splendens TaxID=180675 RepID=UPI001C279D29|nr:E3 ubiquitin-protein ligase RHA2A-like [Salvia splendens]
MGLHNHLSDLSSQSILIITAVLLGKSFSYLQSLILTFLHNLGLLSPPPPFHALNDVVGSGLASLIVLCHQLAGCSYPNHQDPDADCAVCLNRLARGDRVRRLACRHVFHKECFDGWLHHLNFSCPLCRAPVVSDDHVADHLLDWLPPHGA